MLVPVPSEQWLADFYATSTGYKADVFATRDSADQALQFDDQLRFLSSFIDRARGRLFDFGCGDGAFLAHAKHCGWDVVGYEPTADLADAAERAGLTIHRGTMEAVPIAAESLAIVHSAHVLEHLPQPRAALAWMYSRLQPGGVLSLQVPNQFSDFLWVLFHRRWIAEGRALGQHLHHLQFFTPASLQRLVQDVGFEVLHRSTAFEARVRRTSVESRFRAVSWFKRAVASIGGRFGRGPSIELIARRPVGRRDGVPPRT